MNKELKYFTLYMLVMAIAVFTVLFSVPNLTDARALVVIISFIGTFHVYLKVRKEISLRKLLESLKNKLNKLTNVRFM